MDKEKEYLLDFSCEDIEDNNNTSHGAPDYKGITVSKKQEFILVLLVIALFTLSVVFTLMSEHRKNNPEISETSFIYEATTKEPNISEKYKIKTFSIIKDESIILRGRLNITKDDLLSLDKNELNELFDYIGGLNEYNWITLSFSDETGIITLPNNKNVYFYGSLDENSLIAKTNGTIINNSNGSFTYFSNETDKSESISDEQEDNTKELSNNDSVYITVSGTKYHNNGCSYLTETKTAVSLSKAKEQGYLPCSKCIK